MPALDKCHNQVINALKKEGWSVDKSPFTLYVETEYVFIDASLSRGRNGTYEQIILVEVKCFPETTAATRELYTSIGQYLKYRAMLIAGGIDYRLFLAIPQDIFKSLFTDSVMYVIRDSRINLVVINLEAEAVVKWIIW